MKDLEKIKSEDLGCQVQDANPGNFAIEQEVAQLVGATVPAPTEPSADDARELGAQLLVFLRRALLPIRSALRTALAAIYAHLDSRCTDYTPAAYAPYLPRPYDPMRPFVPRTLPNLLTALTAFSPRKISGADVPDGVSLLHLLAEPSLVTELTDNNLPYVTTRIPWNYLPNVEKVQCNMSSISGIHNFITLSTLKELRLDELELANLNASGGHGVGFMSGTEIEEVEFPKLKEIRTSESAVWQLSWFIFSGCSKLKKANFPVLTSLRNGNRGEYTDHYVGNCPLLEELRLPLLKTNWQSSNLAGSSHGTNFGYNCPNLILFEIGQGYSQNLYLAGWNPTNVLADADKTATFLQNFRDHIALRLTSNGSGKTLTLHRDVVDAIDAAEATYGIRHIICNQKGWTISPAPTA